VTADPVALQDPVDAGRILCDPFDAAVCLDFFDGLNCDQFWNQLFDQANAHTSMTCAPKR